MKKYIEKYLVYIFGLYLLSVGIVLIVKSNLGTTPISSVNYVMSLNTPLSLGTWTFLFNMLLVVGQFWLIRGNTRKRDVLEIMLQVPFSFLFAFFIDINMMALDGFSPVNYFSSVLIMLMGCLVQSIGVVFELKPRVSMMSAEAFVNYASHRYGLEFGPLKVKFDVTLVAMAIIISLLFTGKVEGVREGTVIAALLVGHIVRFLSGRVITRRNLQRIDPRRLRRSN